MVSSYITTIFLRPMPYPEIMTPKNSCKFPDGCNYLEGTSLRQRSISSQSPTPEFPNGKQEQAVRHPGKRSPSLLLAWESVLIERNFCHFDHNVSNSGLFEAFLGPFWPKTAVIGGPRRGGPHAAQNTPTGYLRMPAAATWPPPPTTTSLPHDDARLTPSPPLQPAAQHRWRWLATPLKNASACPGKACTVPQRRIGVAETNHATHKKNKDG